MNEPPVVKSRAVELRQAFDQSFSVAPQPAAARTDHLLGIRVGGDLYAVPLGEITGITSLRAVTPVPGARDDLLGLTGVRGLIVPVFRLASVLGYASHGETLRWLILCEGDQPLGLALPQFDGYLRLPTTSLHADAQLTGARQYVRQVAQTSSEVRHVLSIPHIVKTIQSRTGATASPQEQ